MMADKLIQKALIELDGYLKKSKWCGRENEVVNLFAHSFLSKYIPVAQIGIEVAVKQLKSIGSKKLVRKDLVIWNAPNYTVWNKNGDAVNNPIAIIEWKVNHVSKCKNDIEWLKQYTKAFPDVLGYSVCAFIVENRGLDYKYIKGGIVRNPIQQ